MTYEVDYIVKVLNPGAVQAITDMAVAFNQLKNSVTILDQLNGRIKRLNASLNPKNLKLNIDTTQAEKKITALETRVAALKRTLGAASVPAKDPRTSSQFVSHNGKLYWTGSKMPQPDLLGKGYSVTRVDRPLQMLKPDLSKISKLMLRDESLLKQFQKIVGQTATWTTPTQDASAKKILKQHSSVRNKLGGLTKAWVYTYEGTTLPAPVMSSNGNGGGKAERYTPKPSNLGYKLFGHTPLTNNGGMAIDMLRGMGIAYGIAGIGQFFSNIVNDSAGYDNTMQTVENILKSHDKKNSFDKRFASMSNTIRQVGIQTKFKVTEVADAAKFLAMAGLGVEDINSAIRPIANIALVGDTGLGETADLVTNIMTAYDMQSHQMRRASDIMTNTFTMTNTTLPEIAEAYKYAGSLLSAGGVGFEEATAAIGILGDAGIKGSQAGTTMRTILSNIINPRGQHRKKAWKDTGVKLLDEKTGQVRPLAEIFTELAAKDLSVDHYYKLFDKTAASGAVALAAHTEKWNKVIEENFMSRGMAGELADKKKNTIQGLWAQLTSSITEDGVVAFKDVEGQIKNYLRNITSWIQSDNAKITMNGMFKSFMEFMEIIRNATAYLYKFYSLFGWAIKGMIVWQLRLWPIIKTITTLKTAFLAFMGITRFAAGIRAVALAFWELKAAIGGGAAWSLAAMNAVKHYASGGTLPLLPWTSGSVLASEGNVYSSATSTGAVGTGKPTVVYNNSGQPVVVPPAPTGPTPPSHRKEPRMGKNWSKYGKGAAASGIMLAGSAAGYALGSLSDSEIGGTIGGISGGVGGAWLSAFLMHGAPETIALLSNPITWGVAAGAALVGVGIYIANVMKDIYKANKATRVWKESLDNLHISHIDLTKDNALIISYMRTYNNSLLDEQAQLEQSIATFDRYWKAKKGPDPIKSDGAFADSPEGKEFKSWLSLADNWTGKYQILGDVFEGLGGQLEISGLTGRKRIYWTLRGKRFADITSGRLSEEEATRVRLAQLGASQYAPLEGAEQEILKAVTSAKSAAYIADRFREIRKTYAPSIAAEYSDGLSTEEVEKWSMPEIMQSKWFQTTFVPRLNTAMENWIPFIRLMNQFERGQSVSAESVQDALKFRLGVLFDRKQVGMIGTPQWYAKIKDIQTNYKAYGLSKEAADNYVSESFNKLVEFYNQMDDKFKPMFGGFLDRSIWYGALSENETLMSGGYYPGNTVGMKAKDSRGVEYSWSPINSTNSIGAYGWVDKKGRQYFPDTAAGNLSLLSPKGNPFTGSDSYLDDFSFTSKYNLPKTASKSTKGSTAWNWNSNSPNIPVFNGWSEDDLEDSAMVPNVDTTAYKPPVNLYADNAVTQGTQVNANKMIENFYAEIHFDGNTPQEMNDSFVNGLKGAIEAGIGTLFG